MGTDCITMLRPTDALKSVIREHRARKHCYILEDKYGKYVVVAQKLPCIASFINNLAEDEASRVSTAALYKIVDSSPKNRVGGYAKHRWKLRTAKLEEVVDLFESTRDRFEQSIILGAPDCYTIVVK